jgi:tagatose 1,6-diphosphate aldolase GatY/KbaY
MWATTTLWPLSVDVWQVHVCINPGQDNGQTMLVPTEQLLHHARQDRYAVGAFNVYTLEAVRAVVSAAEESRSPAILQILPKALELGGTALIALCLDAARTAGVPLSVHLDHCSSADTIETALEAGISSIMADGSGLPYDRNLAFTRQMVDLALARGKSVEAELGRLSGSEDGMTVARRDACLTDPAQAEMFVGQSGVHALAVCIGNVHGAYHAPPQLDFKRLAAIADRVRIPLVLHGTSGLPDAMITRAVALGVCKFNVNTELRSALMDAGAAYFAEAGKPELVERMQVEISAIRHPVLSRIALFGSAGKASSTTIQ